MVEMWHGEALGWTLGGVHGGADPSGWPLVVERLGDRPGSCTMYAVHSGWSLRIKA